MVLVDAPCSGFGIIRKKPDVRYKKPDDLFALPVIQRAILDNAARYVRPGGTLVYSTCTVLPEENEDVTGDFLDQHPEFEPVRTVFPLPGGALPGSGDPVAPAPRNRRVLYLPDAQKGLSKLTDMRCMTEEGITRVLRDMGQPAFRGKQVFTWLHRGVRSFDEMSNLSKSLRQQLAQDYTISVPTVARKQESRLDGTIKYLWELPDGNCIETVLMQYHHGNTVCISSQVGCRMAVPSAPAPSPERSGT